MYNLTMFLDVFSSNYWIIISFFFIAILYASVGFGGGSSYLAVLSLTSMSFIQYRMIALLCNVVVVSGGTYLYIKKGYFDWKKVLPIVIASVPMAFVGGMMSIRQSSFFIVLGFVLVTAAIMMWLSQHWYTQDRVMQQSNPLKGGMIGAIIGFVSGVVGIGGGVFLAPTLHFSSWDTAKKIAATSSFFILINSVSGIVGQFFSSNRTTIGIDFNIPLMIVLSVVVFIGGQIGSRYSSDKLSPIMIKKITSILIFIVGIRLLIKYFS